MHRSLLVVFLLLPACAPPAAQPGPAAPTTPITAPSPRSPLECSSFSLLVNQDTATAAAVDPVETQMAVMQSRAFSVGAPTWLAASGTMSLERKGRSALISVRIAAQPARSSLVCDWLERRVLDVARSERAQGLDWLRDQELKLQHDADASQEELAAFDKKYDFVAVGLEQQVDETRDELKALRAQHRANGAALRSATERALQLNLQQIERNRLLRNAAATAKLAEVVRDRRAALELDSQLERSIVLLDRCAPCAAR